MKVATLLKACVMMLVGLAAPFTGRAQEPASKAVSAKDHGPRLSAGAVVGESKRRVYVMHSGLHTILSDPQKNIAADSLGNGLIKRGVGAKDVVVLENPYPTASWHNMFPKECVTMFAASAQPDSKVARDAYLRLDKALKAQGVTKDDQVVWIGHSAGGQMGLTMAYLARNLEKYPELKAAMPYTFDMVILLGSPICANLLAPEIKLRHYFSPQDKVVRWAARYGTTLIRTFGYRMALNVMPAHLDRNDKVRVFAGVEHPYWDVDSRVLDRILAETNPNYQPLWCSPALNPSLDASLARLLAGAIEERYLTTFEEPPWK